MTFANNSFDFYNLCEELHNENFNSVKSHRIKYVYANEADILNVAVFGMTAKEWKDKNSALDGNMRDYVNIFQLVILSNLENLNSEMIAEGIKQKVKLEKLNLIAKKQYRILQDNKGIITTCKTRGLNLPYKGL